MASSRRTSRKSSAGFGAAVGILVVVIVVLVGILIRNTRSDEPENDPKVDEAAEATPLSTEEPAPSEDDAIILNDGDTKEPDNEDAEENEGVKEEPSDDAPNDDLEVSTNAEYANASVSIESPTGSDTVSADEDFEAVARIRDAVADEKLKIEFTVYKGELKVKNFSYAVGLANGSHNYITGALSPGDYTLSVGLIDEDGNRVGDRVTKPFRVE